MRKNNIDENEIQHIAKECARVLDEKKGREIFLLDLRCVNNYLDYFLISTGNSLIHCQALAKELQKFLKKRELKERTKTKFDSRWIVLDYNEIIIHIFTQDLREYYQLEKLWADANVINF